MLVFWAHEGIGASSIPVRVLASAESAPCGCTPAITTSSLAQASPVELEQKKGLGEQALTAIWYLDIQGTIKFTDDTDYWQANSFPFVFQNVTSFFKLGGEDVFIYGGRFSQLVFLCNWYFFHLPSRTPKPSRSLAGEGLPVTLATSVHDAIALVDGITMQSRP